MGDSLELGPDHAFYSVNVDHLCLRPENELYKKSIKNIKFALAGWPSWLEHHPMLLWAQFLVRAHA